MATAMQPPPADETLVPAASETEAAEERTRRFWTIPNILCLIRLFGTFVMAGFAIAEMPLVVIGLFIFLEMTDWLDGKLAILLNQRSVFGARLDSMADVTLAGGLLFSGIWLQSQTLMQESAWIAMALGTYAASVLFALWKFRRLPAYHTRSAKMSWGLFTIGAVCLMGSWAVWPFQVAMVAVTLANIEALLITGVLKEFQVDVLYLWRAIKSSRPTSTEDRAAC